MLFMNHTKGIEIIFFKLLGHEEMGRVLKDGGRHSQHPPPAMIKASGAPGVTLPGLCTELCGKIQPHKGVKAPEDCNCGGQESLMGQSQFKNESTASKRLRNTPLLPLLSKTGKAG